MHERSPGPGDRVCRHGVQREHVSGLRDTHVHTIGSPEALFLNCLVELFVQTNERGKYFPALKQSPKARIGR